MPLHRRHHGAPSAPDLVASPAGLPRRVLLVGLVGLVAAVPLGGCATVPDPRDVRWGTPAPPEPDADEVARRRAVAAARSLSARAQQVLAASGPAGGAQTRAVRGVVTAATAHLQALGEDAPAAGATSPATGAAATPGTTSGLVTALGETSRQAVTDGVGVSPGLARLLASVAASRAVTADALARALGQEPAPAPVPAPPSGALDDAAAAALHDVVAGELAAVYGGQVAAAHLDGDLRRQALAATTAWEQAAQQQAAVLAAAGRPVPTAAPGYVLPATPSGAADALALLAALSDRLTAVTLAAVPRTQRGLRSWAAAATATRAVAAGRWRSAAGGAGDDALPGLSDP